MLHDELQHSGFVYHYDGIPDYGWQPCNSFTLMSLMCVKTQNSVCVFFKAVCGLFSGHGCIVLRLEQSITLTQTGNNDTSYKNMTDIKACLF